MSNILEFPSGKITVEEQLKTLTDAVAAGEVEHVAIVTWGKTTAARAGMSTMPAYVAVYLHNCLRQQVDKLMADNGMIA